MKEAHPRTILVRKDDLLVQLLSEIFNFGNIVSRQKIYMNNLLHKVCKTQLFIAR